MRHNPYRVHGTLPYADRVVSNLSQYGNTSAASIPIALDEAVRRGDIQPGQVVSVVLTLSCSIRFCLIKALVGSPPNVFKWVALSSGQAGLVTEWGTCCCLH